MSNNPQVSGNNNIVKLVDAQGSPEYFIRMFKQGHEVLIPLTDLTDKINGDINGIKKLIPDGTSEQNKLVNEQALRELMLNTIGGRTYKTTKIGNQIWLAENLDFKFYGLKVGSTEATLTGEPKAAYISKFGTSASVSSNYYDKSDSYSLRLVRDA